MNQDILMVIRNKKLTWVGHIMRRTDKRGTVGNPSKNYNSGDPKNMENRADRKPVTIL